MASRELPRGGFEIRQDLEVTGDVNTVFAFLTDPTKFAVVDAALVDVHPTTPMALGSAGRMTHRRGGMTARTTWSVTAFDPPNALTVEIHGTGYAMTESAELEATSAGTRIRFVDRVWPTSMAGRVLVALSRRIMERDLRARADRLAAALPG
jgi:carbon monoxide dehydrogenase subunit G